MGLGGTSSFHGEDLMGVQEQGRVEFARDAEVRWYGQGALASWLGGADDAGIE